MVGKAIKQQVKYWSVEANLSSMAVMVMGSDFSSKAYLETARKLDCGYFAFVAMLHALVSSSSLCRRVLPPGLYY